MVAPYYLDPCEGGFVEVDPDTFELTGMVWSYDIGALTGILNWDYVSAVSAAGDYPSMAAHLCPEGEDYLGDDFDWRLPTVAEMQDAVDKGLFADPELMWGARPELMGNQRLDIGRWTSDTRGKQYAYTVYPETGEVELRHKENYRIPIYVCVIPGEGGGPGKGKKK